MTISEPRMRSLLRQAAKVAESGKRSAAEQLYRQIIEEAPDSEPAWLGLAGVLTDSADRAEAYRQVLALNPLQEDAVSELARLEIHEDSADNGRAHQNGDAGPSEPDTTDVGAEYRLAGNGGLAGRDRAAAVADGDSELPDSGITPAPPETPVEEHYDLVCYRHPRRETSLRCYSCGQPICSSCAVKTPVGYRCPNCVRQAEAAFFTATALDYLLAPMVVLPLSIIAGYLALRFGGGYFFVFLMLFIGGAVGRLLGQVARRVTGRRRGRYLPHVVAATVIFGALLPVLVFGTISIAAGVYLFVASSAAFYQMK